MEGNHSNQVNVSLKSRLLAPRLEPIFLVLLFAGIFFYITWLNKNNKDTADPVMQTLTLSLYNQHIGDFLMRFHFVEELFSQYSEKNKADFNKLYDLAWIKYEESLKLLDARLEEKQLSVAEIDKLTKARNRLVCNMAVWTKYDNSPPCDNETLVSGLAKTQAGLNYLYHTGREKEADALREKVAKESLMRVSILGAAGIFFMAVFIFGCIILICCPFFLNRFFPPQKEINTPSWNLKDGFLLIAYGFIIMVFPVILKIIVPNIEIYIGSLRSVPAIVTFHFMQLFLFIIGVYFYLRLRGLRFKTTGLSFPGFKKTILLWLGGYMGMVPVIVVSALISHALLPGEKMSSNSILYVLLSNKSTWHLFLLGILLTVYAPLMEELLFRGVLYKTIRIKFTPLFAIPLSAFIFAFLHGDPLGFIPIFSIGFVLAFVAERSGTLFPGMLIHSLWNAGPFWIAILVS